MFFAWYEWWAGDMVAREGVNPRCENAIKHAVAAADVYSALRVVGVSTDTAEFIVLELGILNERAEPYVRRSPEDMREVKKDLYNNVVGIELAKWRALHPHHTKIRLLTILCQNAILVTRRAFFGRRSPQSPSGLAEPIQWFENNRESIRNRIRSALDALAKVPGALEQGKQR